MDLHQLPRDVGALHRYVCCRIKPICLLTPDVTMLPYLIAPQHRKLHVNLNIISTSFYIIPACTLLALQTNNFPGKSLPHYHPSPGLYGLGFKGIIGII